MARTILSYFPKEGKVKCEEPSGKLVVLDREEFEGSLIAGHEYTIALKVGDFTFSNETYNKIKDRLWSYNG